jgi:DNA-binding ferritin-like protein|tara:strand:+ start:1191 stop:1646 length:456 start_codon:yes stop_codon:yes gene_type:complete
MLKEIALSTIGSFKAVEMWMHAAHHLTKGPSFVSNHELLYGRIYEAIRKDFDTIVEKLIYQLNDEECGCPILISSIAAKTLENYETPANLPDSQISMYALILIVDHIKAIEALKITLEREGVLSLGMDDFLAASCNQNESFAYMINQKLKY